MFGRISGNAHIRGLGLVGNLADYTGSSDDDRFIGGLVGNQISGHIFNSYTTGNASGGSGNQDNVGGLVGRQLGGNIAACWTTGDVNGGGGNDWIGGLVGYCSSADEKRIVACWATGTISGDEGDNDRVGGIVGWQVRISIAACYFTGKVDGGAGDRDFVGGIVGLQDSDGASITASYATGDVAGGAGDDDLIGEVLGARTINGGSITVSYGFGMLDGERTNMFTSPLWGCRMPLCWRRAMWGRVGRMPIFPANAWEFGDGAPKLLYGDYDGTGDVFGCSGEVTILVPNCGSRLPGQL